MLEHCPPPATNDPTRRKSTFALLALMLVGILSWLAYQAPRDGTLVKRLQAELSILERELKSRLNETIPVAYLTEETKRPGFRLAGEGAVAHYPIVMVPGFVTTGLEVWGGDDCARKHYRQRLWAGLGMSPSILTERDCWVKHMMLDPLTGGDNGRARVRAAAGFAAADYFMANYWVWGKLIESLSDLGYTSSTMSMAPYDWRLAFPLMEERDGYFTRLKNEIETLHKITGKKVVLTSHSMGALVSHFFLSWVTNPERDGGGGGGKHWVDNHLHAYINIAGPHLGVPKAASALLSGEMKDTAMLGALGSMVEQFFGRQLRRDLFTTWGSLWTMLPMGGEALWGVGVDLCESRSHDDPFCPPGKLSPLLAISDSDDSPLIQVCEASDDPLNATLNEFALRQYHYVEDIVEFLKTYGGGYGQKLSATQFFSFDPKEKKLSKKMWHDPTRSPLPHAPNMRVYCLYGTGLDTERAYYYKRNSVIDQQNNAEPPIILDATVKNVDLNTSDGIRFADGDGTVPLISLGYLCVDAWQRDDSGLNPSKVPITTREYKHEGEFRWDDIGRGGPKSADHVDTLGNEDLTNDFLRIVTGFGDEEVKKTRIVSQIETLAAKINAHPQGGITHRRSKWLFY